MKLEEFREKLNSTTVDDLPHIFIPSYMRPEFATSNLFVPGEFSDEGRKKVHVVVRPEQYELYKKANPMLDVIPIPKSFRDPIEGLASTRQFIFEYAADKGYDIIFDFDDDITAINFLPEGLSAKKKIPSAKMCSKEIRDTFENMNEKILSLVAVVSREVFRDHPEVMLGNIRKQHFCQNLENSLLKYKMNMGNTPRQTTILNVEGLKKNGINRNEWAANPHGDDILFCAEILAHGCTTFNIPWACYDYISEDTQKGGSSVCRTPETEKELHEWELARLMEYPIKDYLRYTITYPDGSYKWGDIDWNKYRKLTGAKKVKHYWDESLNQ